MGEESQIITKLKGHIEHIISCYEGALFEKSELEKKTLGGPERFGKI